MEKNVLVAVETLKAQLAILHRRVSSGVTHQTLSIDGLDYALNIPKYRTVATKLCGQSA